MNRRRKANRRRAGKTGGCPRYAKLGNPPHIYFQALCRMGFLETRQAKFQARATSQKEKSKQHGGNQTPHQVEPTSPQVLPADSAPGLSFKGWKPLPQPISLRSIGSDSLHRTPWPSAWRFGRRWVRRCWPAPATAAKRIARRWGVWWGGGWVGEERKLGDRRRSDTVVFSINYAS